MCVLLWQVVCTLCAETVLAGKQECYVLAIDFIMLQGFSLSNAGFNLSPFKGPIHSRALHLHQGHNLYVVMMLWPLINNVALGGNVCMSWVFTYCKSLFSYKRAWFKLSHHPFPSISFTLEAQTQAHHSSVMVCWWDDCALQHVSHRSITLQFDFHRVIAGDAHIQFTVGRCIL